MEQPAIPLHHIMGWCKYIDGGCGTLREAKIVQKPVSKLTCRTRRYTMSTMVLFRMPLRYLSGDPMSPWSLDSPSIGTGSREAQ